MPQEAGHPPQQRIEWIDYAKGIGIFLVVLGHVLRGLGDSVGQGYQPELRAMDQWIYAFHMPLFFLLSGLFADRAVSKPPRRFLIDRFQKILYPYFLWSALVGALRILSGQNKGTTLLQFLTGFWTTIYYPIDIFWFLFALFLISTLFYGLRKLKVPLVLLLLASSVLYGISVIFPLWISWDPGQRVQTYGLYFVLGAMARAFLMAKRPPQAMGVGIMGSFLVLTLCVYSQVLVTPVPNPVLALIGVYGCILLAQLLAQQQWLPIVQQWGMASLPIYVSHTIATATTRIILEKGLQVSHLYVHVVLGVIAGLLLPMLLVKGLEHIGFPHLFTLARKA